MVSKGGFKRRSTKGLVPVSFQYIRSLVEKVDDTHYTDELKLRNKALIILLYYSARRISEILGRLLLLKMGKAVIGEDVWEGVKVKDFRFDNRKGRDILVMKCRILKKGKANPDSIRKVFSEVALDSEWPLMNIFLQWFERQKKLGNNTKLFNIGRSRAYQVINELDKNAWLHWLRHQRLSHLGDALNPYQLTERIGFWESIAPSMSYVHGRMDTYLDAGDRVVEG